MADFEHALFMVLLLVGIISATPPKRDLRLLFLLVGLALSLLPPLASLAIPWEWIFSLSIPLLFWQNARHWLKVKLIVKRREALLWASTALGLGLILIWTGYLQWTGALLFGVIAASTLWRAIETEENASLLSQIGPLTLVFLLTEIAPAVETPNRYLGGLFSGAAIGIGVAFLSIYLARRLTPRQRGYLAIGQVYLAYWIALLIDVSGVAASLTSIAVYTQQSLRRESEKLPLPSPLNTWPVLSIFLGLFVVLGWRTHQPLNIYLLAEAGLGLVLGWMIALVGKRLKLDSFKQLNANWRARNQPGIVFVCSFAPMAKKPATRTFTYRHRIKYCCADHCLFNNSDICGRKFNPIVMFQIKYKSQKHFGVICQ